MGATGSDVVDRRTLGRTTLARQLLLDRTDATPEAGAEHLGGLQAQVPRDPYVALWSRVRAFDPAVVEEGLLTGELVRIVVQRGTIHLVTSRDAAWLRPLCQPVLDDELRRHSEHARHLDGLDLAPVLQVAAPLLDEAARTPAQLRALLAESFPDHDAAALAYACRNHLALVQVPPRGLWTRSGQVRLQGFSAWTGRQLDGSADRATIVRRYLAAYGPATAADLATFSRLTGWAATLDALRDELVVRRDESGRELFDLPGLELTDPDVPAPVRFLPEYDDALLSHADRSRFTDPTRPVAVPDGSRSVHGTVLVDGAVFGTWHRSDPDGAGTPTCIEVFHHGSVTARVAGRIEAEGRRLLQLLSPGLASADLRLRRVEDR